MSYEDFKQKVYSYLINYKKEELKIVEKGISNFGVEHDCLFPKPVCDEKIPVMIYRDIMPIVEEIQKSKFAYKPHRAASSHVASSQTACLNLFVPILESEYADQILKQSGVAPKGFDHIDRSQLRKGYCFEYWESSKARPKGLVGDHSHAAGTDSDVAIAYINKAGKKCLWLIEHKLTERDFTTCGGYRSKGISPAEKDCCNSCGINDLLKDHDKCYYHKHCHYLYWDIMDKHASFFSGKYEGEGCPFRGGMNQLWRNQMLALELELEEKIPFEEVYFSVVTHPENTFLDKRMNQYRDLINHSPKFFAFKSTALVNAAADYKSTVLEDKAANDLHEWAKWYRRVYLGIVSCPEISRHYVKS